MGSLRSILALAVVLVHARASYSFVGGRAAVEMFFIISGFYMALILRGKYDPRSQKWLFYSNRLLRIFVPYYTVLTLAALVAAAQFWANREGPFVLMLAAAPQMSLMDITWLAATHLIVLGQETFVFLTLGSDGLEFTSAATGVIPDPRVWPLQLVPQAWTVSLELCFYAIAPFLIRLPLKILLLIFCTSLLARLIVYTVGYTGDPWNYRLFPLELALFLLGMIAHRVYQANQHRIRASHGFAASIILLGAVCLFPFYVSALRAMGVHQEFTYWALFITSAACLPPLFHLTRKSKADAWIGQLSYPIYLVHWPALGLVALAGASPEINTLAVVVVTLAMAWLVVRFVEDPVDQIRQRRLKAGLREMGVAASEGQKVKDAAYISAPRPTRPAAE